MFKLIFFHSDDPVNKSLYNDFGENVYVYINKTWLIKPDNFIVSQTKSNANCNLILKIGSKNVVNLKQRSFTITKDNCLHLFIKDNEIIEHSFTQKPVTKLQQLKDQLIKKFTVKNTVTKIPDDILINYLQHNNYKLYLKPGINWLIGPNKSGKSNIHFFLYKNYKAEKLQSIKPIELCNELRCIQDIQKYIVSKLNEIQSEIKYNILKKSSNLLWFDKTHYSNLKSIMKTHLNISKNYDIIIDKYINLLTKPVNDNPKIPGLHFTKDFDIKQVPEKYNCLIELYNVQDTITTKEKQIYEEFISDYKSETKKLENLYDKIQMDTNVSDNIETDKLLYDLLKKQMQQLKISTVNKINKELEKFIQQFIPSFKIVKGNYTIDNYTVFSSFENITLNILVLCFVHHINNTKGELLLIDEELDKTNDAQKLNWLLDIICKYYNKVLITTHHHKNENGYVIKLS